jgi:hypothetical protein
MAFKSSPLTFTTGAAVSAKRLVKLSSNTVIHNTATYTDKPLGVAEVAAASGDVVAVALLSADGTMEMTAGGVISYGADVYAAADGKVTALSTTGGRYRKVGVALEAATADGDIIQVLPIAQDVFTDVIETITASGALSLIVPTQLDSTAGAIAGTLADGTVIGQKKYIVMTNATNSSTVSVAHHATSDPEVATFDAVDEFIELVWTGTEWETVKATCTFV